MTDGVEPIYACLEPSSDLFGRPTFDKTINDVAPQSLILIQSQMPLTAIKVGAIRVVRPIGTTVLRITLQFPADR